MDTDRRQQLLSLKLRALVRDGFGEDIAAGELGPFKDGATLRIAQRGWVLMESDQRGSFGGALAWAAKHHLDRLHLLAASSADVLARRAACVSVPSVAVWAVEGVNVNPAVAAEPVGVPTPPDDLWVERFRAAGVDPVAEFDELRGEVRGLAVTSVATSPGARLHVGVSVNDREAHDELHAGQPPMDIVAGVAATVAARRTAAGDEHPWRRADTDRWLRSALCIAPELLGQGGLSSLSPWWWPASAISPDGTLLIVCGSGLDLDLVPSAADARLSLRASGSAGTRLIVAVPQELDHPLAHRLAATMVDPIEVVVVAGDWRSAP